MCGFYTSIKIVDGLYFHCSLSVCLLMNKIPAEPNAPIWMRFLLNGCLQHWLNPIEIGDIWSRSHYTVTKYLFFLYNTLLTSLLWISALLCLIKMKFGMPLWYALGRFRFEFHKNQKGDYFIVTSSKFSSNHCPYFKSYYTYKLHTWCKHSTT